MEIRGNKFCLFDDNILRHKGLEGMHEIKPGHVSWWNEMGDLAHGVNSRICSSGANNRNLFFKKHGDTVFNGTLDRRYPFSLALPATVCGPIVFNGEFDFPEGSL